MANIRNLKKEIKYLAADLIDECESYFVFHPKADRRKGDEIVSEILKKKQEIIHEINHLRDNTTKKSKAYIAAISDKVKKELVPLLDQIGKLSDK